MQTPAEVAQRSELCVSDRRTFLTTAAVAALAAPTVAFAQPSLRGAARADAVARDDRPGAADGPVVIAAGNGLECVRTAYEMLGAGADPLDAAVAGVKLVEDDPNDMSVGYGGLPNEDGVVELDSSVMHGPSARAGAVASIRNIKNPAAVAREVARRTDHVLLVGEGALVFARRMGFKEENLLTDRAREAWLRWRSKLNRDDDWLDADEFDLPTDGQDARPASRRGAAINPTPSGRGARGEGLPPSAIAHGDHVTWIDGVPYTTGTIHCSARTAAGDLAGCTTTSGLAWKIPGRVGDSPIIGAGCFTDNTIGSAGATGRGEAVIQICGAHTIVTRMDSGDHPTDACLHALKKIVDSTKPARLLDDRGRPNFQVVFYALRKDGAYGSASMWSGGRFAVAGAGSTARLESSAFLYER